MSKLLEKAIATLSSMINVSAGITHPLDEARAKDLLKALHAHPVPLKYEPVLTLALANRWPENHARKLAELAQHIGTGGRVVIKHNQGWGKVTLKRLQEEINLEKA
jgi:hypothetical protein